MDQENTIVHTDAATCKYLYKINNHVIETLQRYFDLVEWFKKLHNSLNTLEVHFKVLSSLSARKIGFENLNKELHMIAKQIEMVVEK